MHYRIKKVHHEAGKRDELIEILKTKEEILKSFDGLKHVRMVEIRDTVTIAISEYETAEHLQMVEDRFKEVMVDLMPLMSEPPEVHNGDVFWEHEN